MTLNQKKEAFVSVVKSNFGANKEDITRQEIIWLLKNTCAKNPQWLMRDPQYKVGRGKFKLPDLTLSLIIRPVNNTMTTNNSNTVIPDIRSEERRVGKECRS